MAIEQVSQPTTRERILDAAMDLFAEHGFRGTSIAEIERRVGLAAGTGSLYHHFSSKDALLREAIDREVARGRAEMEAARARLPPTDDPDEWHAQLYQQILQDIGRFDRLFRLMLNEGDRVPEIREAMWAALQRPAEDSMMGEEPSIHAVAGASLVGYHLLTTMQGRPYNGFEQEEFIRTLVALTTPQPGRGARGATAR